MLVNRRIVEVVGLDRMVKLGTVGMLVGNSVFLAVALATGGIPPFPLFFVVIAVSIGVQQILTPNIGAAAMRPLGSVAGSAAALIGMVPMVAGSLIALMIDRSFNGTVTPMAVGFVVASIVVAGGLEWARRALAPLDDASVTPAR